MGSNQRDIFDVTIIGGGAAGLYSAFYSGLREMKTKIIEYQPKLGGKIQVYPEKFVWDVGGVPPMSGFQLMNQLVEQGLTFDPTVVLNEKVESIHREQEGTFILQAASGETHYSKTILIATGSGILSPKKLHIQHADTFETTRVHYAVNSLMDFHNKNVIISGGGDTAVDWANALEPVAKKVYIAYRKEQPNGHEANVTQLMNGCATCLPKTCITGIQPCPYRKMIERVTVTNQETGHMSSIEVDDVIVNHGYEQDINLLKNSPINVEMKDGFFIKGNSFSESSVEGVYAAGDILSYEGKVNLIAGAFQDAANAVNQAKRYIEPQADEAPMVSSHNTLFEERNQQINKTTIETEAL